MEDLLKNIQGLCSLKEDDLRLIKRSFVSENVPAQTKLLEAGEVERYVYFLSSGIVKGYQNIDGKLVIQHLVGEQEFFTSLDSFMSETTSLDYFETITDCLLLKIAKPDFEFLQETTDFWNDLVKMITNAHLNCKLERVKDFQILTAKERYVKFVHRYPKLALGVSVENIASFLGIQPQSLSRIRKQVVS